MTGSKPIHWYWHQSWKKNALPSPTTNAPQTTRPYMPSEPQGKTPADLTTLCQQLLATALQ